MKYGGGRPPKNRWSDKLNEYSVGDAMRAEWAYVPAGWFPEQQASTKYYLIIKKAILWQADNGVEWDVVNLETGQVYRKMMLNDTLQKGRAHFFKLSRDEISEKLKAMPKLEESREWWHMCLGTIPDTFIACGEMGQYCSEECMRKANK